MREPAAVQARHVRPARSACLLVALILLVSGCGDEPVAGGAGEATWPSSADVVDAAGLAWALDGVVRLGDGTELDTRLDSTTFVVVGDGVLVADEGLHHVARDGTRTDVGIDVAALAASPDGRLAAAVDRSSGPPDRFGTPRAEVVVADLTTGEEVLRTSEGMGGPDYDLAALYPEIEFRLRFTDATTLVVAGVGETYALDTGGADVTPLDVADDVLEQDPTVSPDGAWTIESPGGLQDRVVGRAGGQVVPQTGSERWNLEWWADATTVVGYAISGGGTGTQVGDDALVALVACQVPAGTCERFDETMGAGGLAFEADAVSEPPYSLQPRYVED